MTEGATKGYPRGRRRGKEVLRGGVNGQEWDRGEQKRVGEGGEAQ